jgi:hypothetical protein
MGKRHEAIGIKQAIRFEWMQKVVSNLLAGMDPKTIRMELHDYLSDRQGDGSRKIRGSTSRSQVVNILMGIWGVPNPELIPLREKGFKSLKMNPADSLVVHWALISAAYPFWVNVAKQIGRLFSLQNSVSQRQIVNRLKEIYGDRETISRYTRCVIRSFINWGVLKDSEIRGVYWKTDPIAISDLGLLTLLVESLLHTSQDLQGNLSQILNHPSLFPFALPVVNGGSLSRHSERIDVVHSGFDDELLRLKPAVISDNQTLSRNG